jgi:hypothetical protein
MWNHADSIPNSDVKRISGEPTGGVTLRKNSSVPDSYYAPSVGFFAGREEGSCCLARQMGEESIRFLLYWTQKPHSDSTKL